MAPRRKGKKNSQQTRKNVNCPHEQSGQVQVTTIISSRSDSGSAGGHGIEVRSYVSGQNALPEGAEVTPLQGAVSVGHFTLSKKLIEDGVSMNSSTMIPHPLCLALQKGHYEIACLLIKAGASVNLPFGKFLPMIYALENDLCEVKVVKKIIDSGFPKNGIVNLNTKETTLHVAVKRNHILVVKYLIGISVDVNTTDKKGCSPFHVAAKVGNPSMINLLVKVGGANINCETKKCRTAIFYAISRGHREIVEQLASLGSDIHHTNSKGEWSLYYGATKGQVKITQLLLEKGADVNKKNPSTGEIVLHSVARAEPAINVRNQIAVSCITDLLISHGSDLKIQRKDGYTPLQVAVKHNNALVARLLIANGSELNNIMEADFTTFHLISKMFDKELINLAFDYGADCMVKNENGVYPWNLALGTLVADANKQHPPQTNRIQKINSLEIVKLFWKHDFPFELTINTTQFNGSNRIIPFYLVALVSAQKMFFKGVKLQKIGLVKKAVRQGAEVNCCSTEIQFPLHFLASAGNEALLRLLLDEGAVVNTLDMLGETPLHSAARAGSVICCQLLLEFGSVYNYSSTKCLKTPLKVAKEAGHSEVVTLLESVAEYFEDLKRKQFKTLKPEMAIFNAVMKCIGMDGLSLLGRAIQYGFKEETEQLAKLSFH